MISLEHWVFYCFVRYFDIPTCLNCAIYVTLIKYKIKK